MLAEEIRFRTIGPMATRRLSGGAQALVSRAAALGGPPRAPPLPGVHGPMQAGAESVVESSSARAIRGWIRWYEEERPHRCLGPLVTLSTGPKAAIGG